MGLGILPCRPADIAALLAVRGDCIPRAHVFDTAHAVWHEGQLLCAFGISSPWPHLGFAWFEDIGTAQLRPHVVALGREIGRAHV